MFMSDWSTLMTPQNKATLEQHAYTYVIRILSTSLTLVSFLSVCCYSRYLSQWVGEWWVSDLDFLSSMGLTVQIGCTVLEL
jgi:hypothetical protein